MSDDTEHTLILVQSLLKHPSDASAFQRTLAWQLRWWLLSVPAGVGLATARACGKLCVGFPPTRSGVFSAGNGPAMRSAIDFQRAVDLDSIACAISRRNR